ncbi:MAG: hypothetical protein LPK45_04735 [Bacteroidota bacterium]|nr:hypothetical protein [Bacteroidota bacterium]MDX5430362.1 hypothetical protein [Bacteroidota bacterium]MDX5469123.1 hypothetical protein [Bacteroidota bacterium]
MAKSAHSFQKRKRELDKQKKREEKLKRKIEKKFDTPATYEEMIEDRENIQPEGTIDASGVESEEEESE